MATDAAAELQQLLAPSAEAIAASSEASGAVAARMPPPPPAPVHGAAAEPAAQQFTAEGQQFLEAADAVPAFSVKWSLSAAAVEWLYALEPTVLGTVIRQFSPRCEPRDVQKVLYSFAKSIAARHGGSVPRLTAAPPGADATGASGETAEDFALRLGLDDGAIEWLQSLEPPVRAQIIADFSPRDTFTHEDLMKKLYAFGGSIANRYSQGYVLGAELRQFVQQWGLDEETHFWLKSLPPQVQGVVVREFAPHEVPHDPATKLRAFARAVEAKANGGVPVQRGQGFGGKGFKGFEKGGGKGFGKGKGHGGGGGVGNQRLMEFVQYWSLDEMAQSALFSLPPAVAGNIVDSFDPRGELDNINRKFMAFLRAVQRNTPEPGPVLVPAIRGNGLAAAYGKGGGKGMGQSFPLLDSFCAHWHVAPEVKEFLMSLPVPVATEIVNRFDPPVDANVDINRRLMNFAQSVASAPRISNPMAGGGLMPQRQAHGAPQGARPAHFHGGSGDGALTPAELSFLAEWGLDGPNGCSDFFARQSPEVRQRVMAGFEPRPGTNDIVRLFCGFCTSIARKAGGGEQPGHRGGYGAFAGMPHGEAVDPNDVEGFAARWGLDAASVALLRGLPDAARQRVVMEFNPRGHFTDIGSKFFAFARSIASAVAAEESGAVPPRGIKRQWPGEVAAYS